MPSVEFLDVAAWQESLRSVCAVENDAEVLSDMRIQWDSLGLDLPIHFVPDDVLSFLCDAKDHYDLYNLDFFGGLLYPGTDGKIRCVDALRSLVHRQSLRSQSFVLITTFNARDKGLKEYTDFIDDVPKTLAGWDNIDECCTAHKRNQATRLKICFPFLCWQFALSNSFAVRFAPPTVYHSSATMVHFYAEFLYQERALPDVTSTEVLAEVVSMPLIRMDGFIPRVELASVSVKLA